MALLSCQPPPEPPPVPRCGDSRLDAGEECDDGNNANGDGCEADCVDVCAGVQETPGDNVVLKEIVVPGLPSAQVFLTSPPRDFSRLFLVQLLGKIFIVKDGQFVKTPFLDISQKVTFGGERGLFSVAFHPDFAKNGRFFVDYTDLGGDVVVSEFRVSPEDPDVADPASERQLLFVDEPFSNHNAGLLTFGPDGYLYLALGDGGGSGDPQENAQNLGVLFGKILRIDVDSGTPYGIPPDNPFVGDPLARPEIWAFGLRNPWRFSFDRLTGDLYIGDVGQNSFEEINFDPVGSPGGRNYGWNKVEGDRHCFPDTTALCEDPLLVSPILEYQREASQQFASVTGGYVYRGCSAPDLRGTYFYADYSNGLLKSFRLVDGVVTDEQDHSALSTPLGQIPSFGEDARGELYLLNGGGRIFHITVEP